jgi:SAM-dependent methyltransferase
MSQIETRLGSGERWGPLWGARPRDWSAIEEQQVPTYEEALRHVEVGAGQRVLDIGCGTGVFLRLVAERGAEPFGLDASDALIAIARERLPDADLRVGEMEALPYDDDGFDLVSGFNAFFFANDFVGALREAGRVAKPGASVVIQVWGPHERNDLEAMKEVVRPFLPPRPPDAPPEPDYSAPGVLESLAREAGLQPNQRFQTRYAFEYPDDEALGRAMMAPAGIAALVGPQREVEVRAAIVVGLAPFRMPEGGYRLENEFHFLIARAEEDLGEEKRPRQRARSPMSGGAYEGD